MLAVDPVIVVGTIRAYRIRANNVSLPSPVRSVATPGVLVGQFLLSEPAVRLAAWR